MTQDIKPNSWSNYSHDEWLICTTKFEQTIFKMVLHEQATSSFIMNLNWAINPHLTIRSELYSKVYNHWTKLRHYESVDFNIKQSLESTEYFSTSKLDDKIAFMQLKPAIIYSKRLMICFDPQLGMIIYIFADEGIMQYKNISITLFSLVLFTMCKATGVEILDFSTIKYDDGNPITLGLKIFSTISMCIGQNEHLSNTQCIVHPIDSPYYLKWDKYSFAMMTHITQMVCCRIQEMLFYDECIISALTQSKQPLLNRFQILAFAPVKAHDLSKQRWTDIHIVLTFSEPIISEASSFNGIRDCHDQISVDTLALLSNLKELPNELQLEVLGQPKELNDCICNCLDAEETLNKCLNGIPIKYLPKDNRVNSLFPILIRKRINSLHSKSTDIYLVVRTQLTRELKYNSHSQLDGLIITNDERKRHEEIKFIDRRHFRRAVYDMNDKDLGALASDQDPYTSNFSYRNNYEGRNNPFFRMDSQFIQIDLCCKHMI
jgi:hypothetical protein